MVIYALIVGWNREIRSKMKRVSSIGESFFRRISGARFSIVKRPLFSIELQILTQRRKDSTEAKINYAVLWMRDSSLSFDSLVSQSVADLVNN